MLRHTSGIIGLPVIGEGLDELDLPMMVARNTGRPANRLHGVDRRSRGHYHRHLGL